MRKFHVAARYCAACLLVVSVSACTSYELEYDRMAGTAFPQTQNVGGTDFTLTSIYAEAGYLLGVAEDQR